MRKLIVAEYLSLDGVMQAPGGPGEDPGGAFRFGGWAAPYDDDAVDQAVQDLHAPPFELLLGRRTYDIWAAYWPDIPADAGNPVADRFNDTTKHVATHRPESLAWRNSQALHGDVAEAVRALKHQNGPNLLAWGSSDLVRQLLAAGLVDGLLLVTCPVVLGHGKRLFGDDAQPFAFTLAHTASTPGGVVVARYEREGEVRTGTFGKAVAAGDEDR